MHKALELASLAKLKETFKAHAFAVAKGASDDVVALFYLIQERPGPHLRLLISAFYAHLDPGRISDAEQLEMHLATRRDRIGLIKGPLIALDCIGALRNHTPPETCIDFWPRIWQWFSFIHLHFECFPGGPSEENSCLGFFRVLRLLYTHHETRQLIKATPGVGVIIGRTWCRLLSAAKRTEFSALDELSHFSAASPSQSSHNTWMNSAKAPEAHPRFSFSLTVEHIDYGVARGDSTCLKYLIGPVTWVVNKYEGELSEFFRQSLLSNEFIGALSRCLCTATTFPPDNSIFVTLNCVILLGWAFQTFPIFRHVREALLSGFLRGIIPYVSYNHPKIAHGVQVVHWIFQTVLLPCTVFYSVLSALQVGLEEVSELVITKAFRSGIIDECNQFVDVAKQRLCAKEYFDSEYTSLKACDNTACAKISPKTDFRRCSGCQNFYYCSKECQISDWREGDHRSLCRVIQNQRRVEHADVFSPRNRSFIRALMQLDFETNKKRIYVGHAMRMYRDPVNPVFTLLDYTAGFVRIETPSVAPPDPGSDIRDGQEAIWLDLVSRVTRSGGQMHLGITQVNVGSRSRGIMLPRRSNSNFIHLALKRIANELPPGLPNLLDAADPSTGSPEVLIRKVEMLLVETKDRVIDVY